MSQGPDAGTGRTPVRTCVGCRTRRPQTDLVRWALAVDGAPLPSRTAPGRGAWLCAASASCLRHAIRRRGFERAWKCTLPAKVNSDIEIAFEAAASNDVTTNMEN